MKKIMLALIILLSFDICANASTTTYYYHEVGSITDGSTSANYTGIYLSCPTVNISVSVPINKTTSNIGMFDDDGISSQPVACVSGFVDKNSNKIPAYNFDYSMSGNNVQVTNIESTNTIKACTGTSYCNKNNGGQTLYIMAVVQKTSQTDPTPITCICPPAAAQ